ncbi:hypothetical protein O6H91_06G038200 [Diphasiastrum complanatum]|uniref:Uncharacterized protein n=1 Tax=Diphasiastrum complanatum TaxID=34168 RepID=A0ACC2DCQ3_DIPCM|nr:hypothetical protein O6H91_06G038200 [Diphasiastrum complanatum]
MAVVSSHQLAQCISCHAWNADLSMVAVCPNNNEVHIYKALSFTDSIWDRVHVLRKHDQLVSSIDWAPESNYIVTASHDRNSYVWNLEQDEWQPTLVILRLNRAAISVKWSPKENKFAVASGAKSICVCYYEQDNNWWVSKIIRKKHNSTVTNISWHPNNVLLATTSTDCKCRVFSAYIKGVDARTDAETAFGEVKFGEQLMQLDLAMGWAFGVKWSPSGKTLTYVGHDSTIHFIGDVGPSPIAQTLALRDLPLRDVLFLSERRIVAAGFDCNPILFEADNQGTWNLIRFLDEGKLPPAETKTGTQFLEAFGKFHGQAKHGNNIEIVESSNISNTHHENCITMIAPLLSRGDKEVHYFSTSGLDGKIIIWDVSNISEFVSRLRL